MARPIKRGLDYFPLDIDFFNDIKVRKLIKYQGGKAVAVYTHLLCNIYRNGYYLVWDDELPFIISEVTGYDEAYIQEAIKCCMNIGLFSKKLFDEERIITSKGIQSRYEMVCKSGNKKAIVSEYNLVSSEETPVKSEETPVKSESSTQRKGNKRKGNKISTDVDIPESEKQASRTQIDYKKLIEFFNSETKGVFGEVRYPLSSKRQDSIRARIREHGKEAFVEMVRKATISEFLKGNNSRGFQATFDWLIKPSNFPKVLEGNYDNRSKETKRNNPDADRLEWLAREAEEAFRS